MQAKTKPVLMEQLSDDERREFARAGKELTRLHLAAAAAAHGMLSQNIYTWLSGGTGKLSLERQNILLSMFGITSVGQLVGGVTHAWIVESAQAPMAEVLLSREAPMANLSINLAYHTVKEVVKLIGAEIRWETTNAGGKGAASTDRRLLITAMANAWGSEDLFIHWLIAFFAPKTTTKLNRKNFGRLEISTVATTNIWRYFQGQGVRLVGGKRPMLMPRTALLPLNQDVVFGADSQDTAQTVLESMTPRFKALVREYAAMLDQGVGPRDKALLRRARAVLDQPDDTADLAVPLKKSEMQSTRTKKKRDERSEES